MYKRFAVVVAAIWGLLPFGALAGNHEEQGSVTDVWIMAPKPGMEQQFAEAAAAHAAKRAEAGDSREWQAYQVTIGHHYGIYQYRACCYDWADLDGYDEESAENGLDADWVENVHPYVAHYHHYIETIDQENSHWPDGERTQGPMFGVTTWHWKEGAGMGPDEVRKAFSQAAKEGGWGDNHEWLWLDRVGGKPVLALVTPYENYASMAPPDPSFFAYLAEHLGSEEEAAAMFDAFGKGFKGSDYTVWTHLPELSDPRSGDD